jgi:enoyl-CoA hydratase/carnithine racemase
MSAVAQQAETPPLLVERAGTIARLTLNRPAARNALSTGLMAALQAELDRIHADPQVHVVVIAAAGVAFSAGHDLKEVRASPTRAFYAALFAQCSRLMTTIVRLRQPVIAQVQGIASAAGCQLVASCDLAVASTGARFATPGVNIGLFCSTPMVALSRNVGAKPAMEMLLTGEAIDAEAARAFGLVNRVVAPERLTDETMALAALIADKSPLVLAIGKEAFHRQREMPLDDAYAYASEVMTLNMLKRDAEEGIDAFIEKRAPTWEGR